MKKLFWGLFFILLNLTITAGDCKIGLLPSFIGYILLVIGFGGLSDRCENYRKIIPITKVAVAYSIIVYILDLLPMGVSDDFLIILGIVGLILQMYILYEMIAGIKGLEKKYDLEFYGDQLSICWKMSVFCYVALHIAFCLFWA